MGIASGSRLRLSKLLSLCNGTDRTGAPLLGTQRPCARDCGDTRSCLSFSRVERQGTYVRFARALLLRAAHLGCAWAVYLDPKQPAGRSKRCCMQMTACIQEKRARTRGAPNLLLGALVSWKTPSQA